MTANIRVQLHDPAKGATVFGSLELVETWLKTPDSLLWMDLYEVPEEEERALLTRAFGIDRSVIDDAQQRRFPPKLERFPNYTFLLLKGLDAQTRDIDFRTIQIAMFIGERFFVTRHSGVSLSTDKLWTATEAEPARIAGGVDRLAAELVGIIVGRYIPILLEVEGRLDYLEEQVVDDPRDELLTELISLRSNLTRMRRVTTYHAQVYAGLVENVPAQFSPDIVSRLNDIQEQLERAVSLTALYYDLAADLMDGYISLASHRLNNIMRLLTVVASIFIPLTFFAGIYGMNFEHMPELAYEYSYYVLLGAMLVLAAALVALFKWKKWL